MIKLLLLSGILAILISGCSKGEGQKIGEITLRDTIGNPSPVEVIKVEDCEYIIIGSGNAFAFSHKGNCNNPIHIYNKVKVKK